jgi:two-component system, NarL family, sensor kinase
MLRPVLGSTGSDPAGREGSRSLSDRLATATAATLAVIAVVAVLTAGRLALIDHASWAEVVGENEAANAILGLTFGLLGALAVVNRPRNGLSWLFVAEGQVNALAVLAARWVAYADNGRPETPLAGLAAWVGAFIWIPGFLLAVVILPLIYPTGRWQSPAWRRVGQAALIFTLLAVLIVATSNELIMRDYPGYSNPLGVFPWSNGTVPLLIIVGCAVASPASDSSR